jgi:hypothetical protein
VKDLTPFARVIWVMREDAEFESPWAHISRAQLLNSYEKYMELQQKLQAVWES